MPIKKFPSPAHKDEPDAYWIGEWSNDEGTETAVVLGKGEREIFDIPSFYGQRIVQRVKCILQGAISKARYNCHDFTQSVFAVSGDTSPYVPLRGEVIEPWQAADRFGLPCGVQFQNPSDRQSPLLHSAVLLGIDPEADKDLPGVRRAVVIHKPGTFELEIVTLADAIARYADRLKQVAFYDPEE